MTEPTQAAIWLTSCLNILNRADVLALPLPRGGVPVAYEVARRLNVPLGVFIVHKLGVLVAVQETCREFKQEVDATVFTMTPTPFYGVGMRYGDFAQTTDQQVQKLLIKATDSDSSRGQK